MLKKLIYSTFAKYYTPYQSNIFLKYSAHLLQGLFGLAIFNYGGIKLTAGPVGFLDNYIIHGRNINAYVTSALSQYLADGGVFLDIGANHGVLSLLAARNSKIKVFAFEPSPRELSRLWKNLALNQKNNISVLAYGIGDTEQQRTLVLTEIDNTGLNSLPSIRKKGHEVTCHFLPLQKLINIDILSQARVCKLDVEGQEMFILNGLRSHMHLFKQCVFVIEMSPALLSKVGASTENIYQFFTQLGFKSQFGNPDDLSQWEEVFYHPSYCEKLNYSEAF